VGTSASNPGPGGPPPLLPPWAEPAEGSDGSDHGNDDGASPDGAPPDDAPPDAAPPDAPRPKPAVPIGEPPTWPSTRRLIGAVGTGRVGGAAGRENVRSGVRSAVGAMGGARRAAQLSTAGSQTAGRFASFLSGVATGGIASAAREFGIAEFLDRSADVFLLRLADALAPTGALTEDAVARDAMDDTLLELFDQMAVPTGGVLALDRMTPALMADALLRYVTNYIYTRVINALTAHIHAKSNGIIPRMREIEKAARHYIEDAVRLDIDTTAFFGAQGALFAARWDAGEGQRVIDRLFEESYGVVQAGLRHGDRGAA